jgi:hypothetical protein
MRLVQAIEYTADAAEIASQLFPNVEDAIEWCETRRGEKLHLGDTNIGYQLMTEAEIDVLGEKSEFPPRWYEIHGVEPDGCTVREIETEDHRE